MTANETTIARRARIYRDGAIAEQVADYLDRFFDTEDDAVNRAFRKMPAGAEYGQYLYLKARADVLEKLKQSINTHIRALSDERLHEARETASRDTKLGSEWLPQV